MKTKEALEERGYRFPQFKSPKARAQFIAKNGYDPAILLNQARRMKDGVGPGWEHTFPRRPRRRGKAKKKG